jgi:hypothetical protein
MGLRRLGPVLLAAGAASLVVAASASAATLTLRTAAGALPVGAPITASSTDFTFTTAGGGELTCDLTTLTGTLSSNSSAQDAVSLTGGSFSGEGEGSPCPTTSGYGPAVVEALNFPWTVELGANGHVKVKAHRKATFKATFTAGGKQGSCVYETSKVAGAFNRSGPLVLNAAGQRFSLSKKGSVGQCPKSGTVSGEFAFSSSGEVVEGEA